MTLDGKIALPNKKQLRISCEEDIERMYKLRNESDAIIIGIGTVLSDDPKLTVKEEYIKKPHQPIRVILDSKCITPQNALAVNNQAETLIITTKKCDKKYENNVEVIQVPSDKEGLVDLKRLLELLYNRGIKKIMVEGGSTVIWSFLRQRIVDEIYVYVGSMVVGGKNTPTMANGEGIKNLDELVNLDLVDSCRIGPGVLLHYKMIE